MSGPDIFISYNREDAAIAQLYADALTGAGLTVWWDATLRSGEDYDAVTEQSLRTAKAVVVLWSPRSVNSRWVRAEATIADRGHTMAPVMIEACDRPVMFELKQTVEMSHWRGDPHDKAWLDFVADLRRKTGRAAPEQAEAVAPAALPVQPQAGPVTAGRSTVAVLPVGYRSGDDELEVLAEDLTEDITRELAHNGHFRVIAAGSMAAWRGKAIDHKDVGRQLEARYLVEGKLQRSGKDNRLTAQLIDGNTGNVLWSTRLVGVSDGAAFSADTLPVAAAAQFAEQIVQREQTRAMAKRAPYSAWDHIFRSAAHSLRADQDGARQAVEEAQLAVAAAPDIGLAHALLASALAALPEALGQKPDPEQIREIQAQTRQAMRLDGNNPSVLMALAGAYKGLGEYEICLRLARRTVELWPSSPLSYLILGNSYRLLGRTAEAIAAYRKQDQLSPFDSSRNVALTCLGECLLAEGQPEAAEDALDRALMLDPEYPAALEWKAIIADHLGKERAALDVIRQIRSAEAAVPLDQHVWQIERDGPLHDRTAAHVATLRRLWLTIDGPVAAPTILLEAAEAATPASQQAVPDPAVAEAPAVAEIAAPEAAPKAADETTTVVLEPAAAAPAVALDPGAAPTPAGEPAAAPSAIPLKAEQPAAAKRARSKLPTGNEGGPPPPQNPDPAPSDEYLIKPMEPKSAPTGGSGRAANDDVSPNGPVRRFTPQRAAMLGGAIVLAGIGGAALFTGGNGGVPGEIVASAPAAVLADLGITSSSETATAAAPALAPAPAAFQPLTGAMAGLITASRNARRPQAELAALVAGQQKLNALIAQSAADPGNTAIMDQISAIAVGLVRQQGAALSGDGDRWLKGQEQAAAAARRSLPPEGAAIIDRALNKARVARADLAAAVGASGRAPDAVRSLVAARSAVAAYSRLTGMSVGAAVASARAAAADTDRLKERLSRTHAEIEAARADVGRLAGQVAGLATIEKPGLFASGTKKQSFKLRKDNAEKARTLAAEADRIAATSGSVNDPGQLQASLTRLQSLRSQASSLLASSNAVLKAKGKADDKAGAPDKK